LVDIVFTGGGTAGHVTPNLALFPDLQKANLSLAYIGQSNSIEESLVKGEGVPFYPISAGKLRRYIDFQNFTDVFKILLGFLQAFVHLTRLRPKLVFSKGGFVSSPVVWAAWICRIPIIIHESDISPGLANKLAIPFANKVCYSFPETEKYLPPAKRVYTGVAIREFLKQGDALRGRTLCGFSAEKPVIVIIGGSQGSKALNLLVRSNLTTLCTDFNICHLCGAGETDALFENYSGYKQFEYLRKELPDVFAMATLIISRAGATSLFEFLSLMKPSLLIPLPLGASRGDQILNAQSFAKQGFSVTIDEASLHKDPKKFVQIIKETVANVPTMKEKMAEFSKADAKVKLIALIKAFI